MFHLLLLLWCSFVGVWPLLEFLSHTMKTFINPLLHETNYAHLFSQTFLSLSVYLGVPRSLSFPGCFLLFSLLASMYVCVPLPVYFSSAGLFSAAGCDMCFLSPCNNSTPFPPSLPFFVTVSRPSHYSAPSHSATLATFVSAESNLNMRSTYNWEKKNILVNVDVCKLKVKHSYDPEANLPICLESRWALLSSWSHWMLDFLTQRRSQVSKQMGSDFSFSWQLINSGI